MINVKVTNEYPIEVLAPLKSNGFNVSVLNHDFTLEETNECQALLIRSRTKVNEKLLSQFPQLKLIVTATSGFDHIDLNVCEQKNICVSYTPTANAQSAAEHTFMLILALNKLFIKSQKRI